MNRLVQSAITFVTASMILGLIPSAALSLNRSHSKDLTAQQIAHQCLESIVSITVLNARGEPAVQGSGFVIGTNEIASALHFFNNAHSVTVNYPNGRSEPVYGIINLDADRDICILYANTSGVAALPLGSLDDVQIGDPVVALGCPAGLGASVSTGIVSGLHNVKGTKIVQTTAPISHESAGGALVDRHGRVLGVTSFMIDDGQNLNFAYASYYASQLIPRGLLQYWSWDELELWHAKSAAKDGQSTPTKPAAATTQPAVSTMAAADTVTNKPLAGLTGFDVEIDSANSDLKTDGIDADALKANAVKRLKDAGIQIYDDVRSAGNDTGASLFFTYNRTHGENGADDVYNLHWQLVEVVSLLGGKSGNVYAQVWDADYYGHIDHDDISKTISDLSDKSIDDLIKTYDDENGIAPPAQPSTPADSSTAPQPTSGDSSTTAQPAPSGDSSTTAQPATSGDSSTTAQPAPSGDSSTTAQPATSGGDTSSTPSQ